VARDPVDGVEAAAAASFLVAIASGIGLLVAFVSDAGPAWEGALLGAALFGLAIGIGLWAVHAMPGGTDVEARHPISSTAEDRAFAVEGFERGERVLGRRGLLVKLLGLGAATVGAALLIPIRSLGPNPGRKLLTTPWRPGRRLVTESGEPLRPGDLEVNAIVTVFPEGDRSPGDAQTVLIRLPDGANRPKPGREGWTVEGCIAYSKVCTHAGCPVGLYEADTHRLVCPCHQSLFEVADGARPSFGPATRSLPQLPLEVDEDGHLRASGDFSDPIGPAWWGRP
jgi:ubiquinol-cytochrome c reductase iron-sulfur subunit